MPFAGDYVPPVLETDWPRHSSLDVQRGRCANPDEEDLGLMVAQHEAVQLLGVFACIVNPDE